MNLRRIPPVVPAAFLAGTGGFFLGKAVDRPALSGPGHSEAAPKAFTSPAATPSGLSPASLLSPELRWLLGEDPVPDGLMHATTLRALAEADPARRIAAVALLLDSMTASNAASIRQAFIDTTVLTGRRHDSEWVLMLKQYGKALGKEAFDQMKDNPKERGYVMEGWAMADPEAALAVLDREDPDYYQMRVAALNGITKTNPALGFQLGIAEPNSPINAGWLIQCAIQAGGMEGATAALQQALDTAGPEVEHNGAFRRLFSELADAMFYQTWTSGQSEKMLTWLEAQKDQPFVTPDLIDHGTKDVILQGKLPVALDWLERMNAGRETGPLGVESMMQVLAQHPGILANIPAGELDRVVAMAPSQTDATERLAGALTTVSPVHAERLRALALDPTRFDPPQTNLR